MRSDFDSQWEELSQSVLTGMKQWRLEHPKATLSEMEQALDERLGRLRARMLEDLALASPAAHLNSAADQPRAVCPGCGSVLESRGAKLRQLRTHHDQPLSLWRSYGVCPTCQVGFFPPGSRTRPVEGGANSTPSREPGETGHVDALSTSHPRVDPLHRGKGQ